MKFFKELVKGSKWVIIAIVALALVVAVWIGSAWSMGWFIDRFFDLKNFGPLNYIAFGSSVLAFILVIQIVTVVLTGWFLISWGRTHKAVKRKEENVVKYEDKPDCSRRGGMP